jgi:hypothetical protein
MKNPFSASAIKIARARKLITELEAEAAAYASGSANTFDAKTAQVDGRWVISFDVSLSGAPESMAAIIGDIVHNLRASLDLAACDAVRAAGKNEKQVYFPFSESEAELEEMIKRRNFDRAGTDAVDLLKSLKPYRNGNSELRLVHDLDIQDKHRALIPQAVGIASPVIRLWDDDGTINPTVMGDPNIPSQIKFLFPPGTGLDGRELIPTLNQLVQLVDSIIDSFRELANRITSTP